MQLRRSGGKRLLDGERGGERLVLDANRPQRSLGLRIGFGRHRGHLLADEAHFVACDRRAVGGAVMDVAGIGRKIVGGDDRMHARHRAGAAGVDRDDAGVGMG